MKRDLFDVDTPSEALIDTGRRAGSREPQRRDGSGGADPAIATPETDAGLARARVCVTCARSSEYRPISGERTGRVNCAEQQPWFVMEPGATCHFTPSRWVAMEASKLAKVAKQAGIDQAVGAADRAAPGWSDQAYGWIAAHAERSRGVRLTGYELVRRSIMDQVPQPENAKAWGGPIQRAARAGYLVKVGTVADPNPERHGSDVPLWECACRTP